MGTKRNEASGLVKVDWHKKRLRQVYWYEWMGAKRIEESVLVKVY